MPPSHIKIYQVCKYQPPSFLRGDLTFQQFHTLQVPAVMDASVKPPPGEEVIQLANSQNRDSLLLQDIKKGPSRWGKTVVLTIGGASEPAR
ncbi:hypothetical protein ES703_117449 [subsurface metagenome]